MPQDLKLSQIGSSPLPPSFGGLHSPGVRKYCQIIFVCYFPKSSIVELWWPSGVVLVCLGEDFLQFTLQRTCYDECFKLWLFRWTSDVVKPFCGILWGGDVLWWTFQALIVPVDLGRGEVFLWYTLRRSRVIMDVPSSDCSGGPRTWWSLSV